MVEQLRYFLKTHCQLQGEALKQALQCFKPKKAPKNTILLFKGDVCNHLYFIGKGSIRTYFVAQNGSEKTRFVAFDGSVVTAFSSFISQKPSLEYVETLEDSELLSISFHDFFLLKETLPGWSGFYTKVLESAYLFQSDKIESLMTLTAKQRYDDTIAKNPEFLTRLSNRVFATYLDISQETLSRIKSM